MVSTDFDGSIYQYSSMAPRLSGQNCKFSSFFCPSILKRDFDTKTTPPNIEVLLESLWPRQNIDISNVVYGISKPLQLNMPVEFSSSQFELLNALLHYDLKKKIILLANLCRSMWEPILKKKNLQREKLEHSCS